MPRFAPLPERRPAIVAGASSGIGEATAIELAAEFSRAVEPDPLLPPELLPQPWIGVAARARVADCWAELLKSDAPQRIKLFQWYSEVVAEVAARSRSAASV